MPAPTGPIPYDLSAGTSSSTVMVRRRTRVNPYTAGNTDSGSGTTTPSTLPPAPPVGLVYPR